MQFVLSKNPLPGKAAVGQQTVRGTTSIHAPYSRPTIEFCRWDKGGQATADFPGDFATSHPVPFESDDMGRSEAAYTRVVPRFPAVPPCNHVEQDDGRGVDLMHDFMEDGLMLAETKSLKTVTVSMQPAPCGGQLALRAGQTQTLVLGARHGAD